MTPTDLILNALQTLLGEDPATLAPVTDGLLVHLANAAFTPSVSLVLAGLSEADFTGAAALEAGAGPCQLFTDGISGLRVIQLNEPLGGWHWQPTNTSNLPQIIYGYYVTDNPATVLYGAALFPTPYNLSAVGQGIDVGQIRFTLMPNALT